MARVRFRYNDMLPAALVTFLPARELSAEARKAAEAKHPNRFGDLDFQRTFSRTWKAAEAAELAGAELGQVPRGGAARQLARQYPPATRWPTTGQASWRCATAFSRHHRLNLARAVLPQCQSCRRSAPWRAQRPSGNLRHGMTPGAHRGRAAGYIRRPNCRERATVERHCRRLGDSGTCKHGKQAASRRRRSCSTILGTL